MIYLITHTNFYKNWGDVAIDLATMVFLDVNDCKYKIINEFSVIPKIKENDIVLIRGGGYFGLYNGSPEKFLKKFLFTNAKKKILLPSSLYFDTTSKTIDDIKNLKLIIFARDFVSLQNYKSYFKNSKILYCPDMALFLAKTQKRKNDKTIKLIARGTEKKSDISSYSYKKGSYVNNLNWKNVATSEMFNRFKEFLTYFSNTTYIISDSLHCCLFSYLCNMGCFAFDNKSGKVFNTLKCYNLPNIKFCSVKNDIVFFNIENKEINLNYNALYKEIVSDECNF